jgi:predicted O-methyltransferase YrrM
MNNDGRGFSGRLSVYEEVAFLAKKHKIRTAVETGTYEGDTTLALAEIFDEVHTVELSRSSYLRCVERLRGVEKIFCHHGNSPDWLKSFLANNPQPIFFYFDAHWYEYWPILDELRAIALCGHSNAVIAIDDFQVPGRPDFGFDSYANQPLNWDYIKNEVAKVYRPNADFHHYYNVKVEGTGKGVAFIEPLGEKAFCSMC